MSVGTVIILSVVATIIAALVLAPPVTPPRADGRPGRRELRPEQHTGRHRSTDAPRLPRRRLRTVPEPRSGRYRRTAG
ncbi:hypothetical protein [Streptomyces antarcticus]|uniref:hypothetical protein n=1 Tax=Streptomyces antarcticus TaxID=2996458 RepID=UPI00226EDD99|nr:MULTISPECIES: hypothetical protein [unclassified Streptomyces]MCY0944260.1 hypothetical protein [Streptomyces sp. H34-AA3]MCZ4087162.1 hypothetical protein [Streptomyces sp. H34-S5]